MRVYGWTLSIIYVVGRVVILLLSPGPQLYPDSPGYRVLDGSSWSVVSFTGHATRLWGVPAFYALLPSDSWRVLVQWAISTVAWGGLAWVLWRQYRALAARAFAAAAVAVLAVLPQVTQWDFAILSESLTISLGVATLALYLRWRDSGKKTTLVALISVSILWAFTRFEIVFLLGFLAVAIAWTGWRRHGRRATAILAFAAVGMTLVWVYGITTAIERNTRWSYSGGGVSEELVVYRLGWQVYQDPRLERVYREELGMPDCPGLANQARRAWSQAEILAQYKNCPQLGEWARANGSSLLIRLAFSAPGEFLRTTVPLLSLVYSGHANVMSQTAILPGVDWLVFPPVELSLEVTAAALALLILGGYFVSRTAAVLGLASIVSSAALLVASCSSLERLGIQETVLVRIGLIILAAALIDRLSKRGGVPAVQDDSPQSSAPHGDPVDDSARQPEEAAAR